LKESNYFNISVNHSCDIAKLDGIEAGGVFQEKQKGFVVTNIEHSSNTYYDITLQDGSSHKFIIDGGIVTHNCGGANLIDKIPNSFKRIGYDINEHVIMALIDIRDNVDKLPESVSEDYYKSLKGNPHSSITSWIRFVCSFGAQGKRSQSR